MKAHILNKRSGCPKWKNEITGFIYFIRGNNVFFNDGKRVLESSYTVQTFLADVERNFNDFWVKVS